MRSNVGHRRGGTDSQRLEVVTKMKYVNLGSYIFMIALNAMATLLPLNGQSTAEVSAKYPTLFTPAGYVFSIWGLIYLLLGVFVVGSFFRDNQRVERIGYLFAISSVLNGSWIIAWHWEMLTVSIIIMLALLTSLILIVSRLQSAPAPSGRQRWMVDIPFSVYLGWISVATIANVSVFLTAAGWNGWGMSDLAWTVAMIVVAGILGALAVLRNGNFAYALVIIWALAGVGAANADRLILASTAWGVCLVLAMFLGYRLARKSLIPNV
ncbi:MAG: tryptophan-rich sensory protein [Bacillota bacterium]